MSQCVPSWDLDDAAAAPRLIRAHSNSSNSLPPDVPSLDYEVAELTWENGQLAMHGLGPPRMPTKPAAGRTEYAAARAGAGTLESIVSQATCHVPHLKSAAVENAPNEVLVPWFDYRGGGGGGASMAVTMDAFVPCANRNNHHRREGSWNVRKTSGTCTARVGKCSCKTNNNNNNMSASESTATCREPFEDRELCTAGGFTSTSLWSPDENTSSGKEDYTKTTSGEDHDSVCHSRSQREGRDRDGEVEKKKGNGKSSVSTKRSRAAAIHNQSERKRRDKINQRMKTLQKLVPNSSKTDKASILDEVIDYLKQLQAQVQMMSRLNMNMPQMNMMLPLALQQMSMMAASSSMPMHPMPHHVMDFSYLGRTAGMAPIIPPPAFMPPMPASPWDMQQGDRPAVPDLLSAFLACQSQQPMTMDAYSRLASLYQQFQQGPSSGAGAGAGAGSGAKN